MTDEIQSKEAALAVRDKYAAMVESLKGQLKIAEQKLQIAQEILGELGGPSGVITVHKIAKYDGLSIGTAILDVLQTHGNSGLTVSEIIEHLTSGGFNYSGNPNAFYATAYSSTRHLARQDKITIGEKNGKKCFYPKID